MSKIDRSKKLQHEILWKLQQSLTDDELNHLNFVVDDGSIHGKQVGSTSQEYLKEQDRIDKMTNRELIEQHDKDTVCCSVFHHMQSASSTYETIITKGESIIPDILKYMSEEKYKGGMSIMMLLMEITKDNPYDPEPIKGNNGKAVDGFIGYKVGDAWQAWINWGKTKGHITL